MQRDFAVLNLHGIGRPRHTYADLAMKRLGGALKKQGHTFRYQSVHYDPLLDAASRAYHDDQTRRGMDEQPTRGIVDHTLSDALVGTNPHIQSKIFELIDAGYARLRTDDVIIIGHSMGTTHAVSWLNSRRLAKCTTLVTMAANSVLWFLGDEYPVPAQVAAGQKWLNVVDRDDSLGAFLGGITKGAARDLEVKLGGWFSWTAAAHGGYWNDERLFSKTLPALLAL